MAVESKPGDCPVVWTFLILGGDENLMITLPNNPPLVHNGHRTVWKLLGSDRIASAAEELIRASGATVSRWAEVQSEDQTVERKAILGILGGSDPTSIDPNR